MILIKIRGGRAVDLRILERKFSDVEDCPSVLLANIHLSLDIQYNIAKMEHVIEIAHENEVNIVIFPELCVTGYIWATEDDQEIIDHMRAGDNGRISGWVNNVRDNLSEGGHGLQYVFYNNVRIKNGSFYNSTFIINKYIDHNDEDYIYDKIFLPPIEQRYFKKGTDKRLIIDTKWGRFGFLTCYDLNFVELARKYAFVDEVDAIITMADWRSEAIREYPDMNIRTDHYYGFLWNLMNSSKAAYNQIWSLAVNSVGRHDISGDYFWGGSGVWAPSGLMLLQASNINEELLIIRNLDIKGQRDKEQDTFNYRIDFQGVHRKIEEIESPTQYLP